MQTLGQSKLRVKGADSQVDITQQVRYDTPAEKHWNCIADMHTRVAVSGAESSSSRHPRSHRTWLFWSLEVPVR